MMVTLKQSWKLSKQWNKWRTRYLCETDLYKYFRNYKVFTSSCAKIVIFNITISEDIHTEPFIHPCALYMLKQWSFLLSSLAWAVQLHWATNTWMRMWSDGILLKCAHDAQSLPHLVYKDTIQCQQHWLNDHAC